AAADLAHAARRLECAGAEWVLICANTMHKAAPAARAAVGIPLLHLAGAAGERARGAGLRKVALLGTRYTMEEGFLKDRLRERFGFEVLIPPETERGQVHRVIFEELVLGKILPQSKETYLRIIDGLVKQGAQGIIL